jgi:F0F1-type ATP synthase assembly protein I
MEKKPISHFVVGSIIGLISIVLFLVYYFTGNSFKEGGLRWIPSLVTFVLIIFFIIKWANDNSNNVSFGGCFGYGFKSVIIMALISVVFTVLFIIIFPEFKEKFMDVMRAQMENQPKSGEMPPELKEKTLGYFSRFFYAIIIGGGLLGNLFTGAISSLIGAAVAKKNPNYSPVNDNN